MRCGRTSSSSADGPEPSQPSSSAVLVAEQAAAMVRLLLNLFEGGPTDPIILHTELVVRESA